MTASNFSCLAASLTPCTGNPFPDFVDDEEEQEEQSVEELMAEVARAEAAGNTRLKAEKERKLKEQLLARLASLKASSERHAAVVDRMIIGKSC